MGDISINIEHKNAGTLEIVLTSRPAGDPSSNIASVWISDEDGPQIIIHELKNGGIKLHSLDPEISTSEADILSRFYDVLSEKRKDDFDSEEAGIEPENEEIIKSAVQVKPYDPDLIRVDPKPFSIQYTCELMRDGDIDLSPDFQRHFVWKESRKKSRLIESVMLRIPLPVFYLAQDLDGKFQVVDGLQRLTVLKDFLGNKFRLTDLEYLHECEGKLFKDLDPKYVRRINQSMLTVNIIDPQTPGVVKIEIFKRINQGGKPLKAQEIRNCMASPRVRKLINELATSDDFLAATNNSVNPLRMEDQELTLRFLGFYISNILCDNRLRYSGAMDTFLDETLDLLNRENPSKYDKYRKGFLNAMKNAEYLFGKHAFRRVLKNDLQIGARKQLINKSLFTTWSVLLSEYDFIVVKEMNSVKKLLIPLVKELEQNTEYYESITMSTNDLNHISRAFSNAQKIIERNLEYAK